MLSLHEPSADRLSLTEARRLVHDLFEPNPVRFWVEFLVSILSGHACYALTRALALGEAPLAAALPPAARYTLMVVAFVAASLLYYRSAMFIHELVHLRSGTFTGFRIAWNALAGIPFFIPSHAYYPHLDHHRRKHYGTHDDGEYLPLARHGVGYLMAYLVQILLAPAAVYLRYLVLTPLGWISPRVRRFTYKHMSSLVMDPLYVRPLPAKNTVRIIYLQEALVFIYALAILVVPTCFLHRWPLPFFVQGYLTGVFTMTLNHVRTLGAHRWRNHQDQEMTFIDQLADSVNIPQRTLANHLWGPIGLHLHALHHLFPSLPYHNLDAAHRRLVAHLPADSVYRQTEEVSLTSALLTLWRDIRSAHLETEPAEQELPSLRRAA